MKQLLFSTLIGSMVLAGCTPITLGEGDKKIGFTVSEETIFHHDLESIETLMRNEVFGIEVINITDGRGPKSFANEVNPAVIHEYRPEKLTRALIPYLEATLKEKLNFHDKKEKTYFAEYTLKGVDTKIITGNFWSGKFGEYKADISFDVIIRDESSKVLVQKTLSTTSTMARRVVQGRQPSLELDEQNMRKTLDLTIKKIALFSGWELRQTLNGVREYYDPLKKNSIDTVYE